MNGSPRFAAGVASWVLVALGGCAAGPVGREGPATLPRRPDEADLVSVEITTVGWDALGQAPVVLLRDLDRGRELPIWVGVAEAQAIAAALGGLSFPRPMTHDLMAKLVDELGAKLKTVLVHDLAEGTYYALLELEVEGEDTPRLVDTRPSDGLALALRTGAAIKVHQKLFDQAPDVDFRPPGEADQVVRVAGLTLRAVTAELRSLYQLPERAGVVVTEAREAAAAAGIEPGDLVFEANGKPVVAPADLIEILHQDLPRDVLRLRFLRGGEELDTELDLGLPARRPEGQVASFGKLSVPRVESPSA